MISLDLALTPHLPSPAYYDVEIFDIGDTGVGPQMKGSVAHHEVQELLRLVKGAILLEGCVGIVVDISVTYGALIQVASESLSMLH